MNYSNRNKGYEWGNFTLVYLKKKQYAFCLNLKMDDCVVYFSKDIQKDILLRCPVKSLLRFKCVIKSWYALIKNPELVPPIMMVKIPIP